MQFVSSQGNTPQIQLLTDQSSLLEKELEVLNVQSKKDLLHQLKKDSERPFNIFQAPLFRLKIGHIHSKIFMYVCYHHALMDGMSGFLALTQVLDIYEKLKSNADPVIENNTYSEFINYEKSYKKVQHTSGIFCFGKTANWLIQLFEDKEDKAELGLKYPKIPRQIISKKYD